MQSKSSGFYSTKYEPPKKPSKEKKISANVQKFLQSQEQKVNTDKPSPKPSGRTAEPDAYESREASEIYKKLLDKFENAQSGAPSSKANSKSRDATKAKDDKTKSSVKDAASASASKTTSDKSKPAQQNEKPIVTSKPKLPAAKQLLDFNSLLQLAEQNKASGAMVANANSKGEPTRLLTKKEKRKIAAEKERRNPPPKPNHSKNIPSTHKDDEHASSSKAAIPKHNSCPEKTRAFPPADVRTRQFPPPDLVKSRQFPPNDVRPDASQPQPGRKRHIMVLQQDSSSEEDSDMDDFIDDDDAADDYSQHIKDIFGYDKSRYRHIDDGADDNMVSTFAQQMREEQISKKIGRMEDLEDMQAEAAAEAEKIKRRKARKP